MRKFLALAALVLGLAACQTEPEGLNVTMGGEQEVTISVAIPEVETRAGDVNSAQGAIANGIVALDDYTIRYALQIFDKDGNASEEIIYKYSDTETVSFPVRLVPEREYTFVVWADIVAAAGVQDGVKSADLHYAIGTTLEEISIIESEWRAMDETRDAFTGKTTLTFNGNNNISIDLYRPFAKLRVVTTDYNELAKFNITPAYAVVKYATPHYSKFNAYESKAVPTNTNAINDKEHSYSIIEWTNEDNSQRTLFADYFFAEDGDIVKFDMSVYEDAAKTTLIKYNNFNTDINVKRNHLTTLKGDILTTGGNVTVTVKPGLEETVKEYKEANSAQDLQNAIDEAEDGEETVIVLGDDIDLSEGIILFSATRANEPQYAILVPAGKVVTLDLNGKTISYSKEQTAAFSMLQNNGTLTITDTKGNGKLSYKDSGNGGEYVSNVVINNNVMTINGGIIENNSVDAVAANGYPHAIDNNGVLTINGGTFSNNSNYSSMRIWCTEDDNTIVTINGGTFNGCIDFHNVSAKPNKGTLTINGGTFNADTYTKSAVRLLGFGTDVDEMVGYINGGTYNGKIALNNYAGGEFNAQVFFITGGTFTTEAKEGTNEALLVFGYGFEQNGENWKVVDFGYREDENGNYTIASAKGLAWVAEQVNSGTTTFAGKTITLTADIELNNENWTAIGTPEANFCGTFDGCNYTIKNLKILVTEGKEDKAYLGLFGYAKNATIKNVAFENVDINVACLDIDHSQGHIGAVAGSLEGTSTIENVTVKGDVKVEATFDANGASRVAVVAGGNSYGNVTMRNVHVKANNGSYLKANNNVGALAGQLQGKSIFEECSSNIDVTGKKFFAGGIIGLAAGDQIFTNCHTTGNITITQGREGMANDHFRVGGIAGGWADNTKTPLVVTNCSYSGKVSGKDFIGNEANPLDYAGYVGRGYTLANREGSKVIIDGVEFVQVGNSAPYGIYSIDGYKPVSNAEQLSVAFKNGGKYYLANDITIADKWDNRKTGKATTEISINGNGKTIKFTGEINDGYNFHAAFRFENTATVKNLTLDMSEATAPGKWLRAISSHGELTIENCRFIGNTNYTKANAVVFGDKSGVTQHNYAATITGCTFTNWSRGISDNENANELKNITVSNNTCTNAHVYISAYNEINVTNNVMSNGQINITSYSNAANAKVKAIGNTLDANQYNVIGSASKTFTATNVEAQEGFIVNAQ